MSEVGVDAATLARLMNLSLRGFYKRAATPGFPAQIAKGRWSAPQCSLWYIRNMRAELERRGGAGAVDSAEMRAERLALVAARAEKIRMENSVARGELVLVDTVRDVMVKRLINCKQRMRAIPSSVGPTLTNKSDPGHIVGRLRDAIDQALAELEGPEFGGPQPPRDARRRTIQ